MKFAQRFPWQRFSQKIERGSLWNFFYYKKISENAPTNLNPPKKHTPLRKETFCEKSQALGFLLPIISLEF